MTNTPPLTMTAEREANLRTLERGTEEVWAEVDALRATVAALRAERDRLAIGPQQVADLRELATRIRKEANGQCCESCDNHWRHWAGLVESVASLAAALPGGTE